MPPARRRFPRSARRGRPATPPPKARARRGSWSPRQTCRCARRPSRCPAPADRARPGCLAGRSRKTPRPPAAHGTRRGSRPRSAGSRGGRATQEGSGRYEALHLPRQAEPRAFAAQHRLESRLVGNAFVDFHIGGGIVAAAHPAAAHAEFALDRLEQRLDRRSQLGQARRIQLVRSEEHTSELQSPCNLVCRLLLEKKKRTTYNIL